MAPTKATPSTPVTARAVVIGLLAVLGINLIMNYNDYYLLNSLLIGNHFPVVSIALIFLLIVGFNAGLARRFALEPLAPGELLLIWSMVGVGGGLCAAGFMRYFPSWMVNPAYYMTEGNEYLKYFVSHLPSWMVVSKDPQSPAVRWFMEGMPHGASIPWSLWVTPITAWFSFVLLLYAANLALVSLFFKQWSERERLIFPVVQLPLAMAAEPAPGQKYNALFLNPLTWIGASFPIVVWGWSGLGTYFPRLPSFQNPLFNMWSMFPDRPWSEFTLDGANLYFCVVGMTYLLTTEMGFSLWIFFVLLRLSKVFIAWLGSGATGFWGDWDTKVSVFETLGCMVALTVFLFWGARRHLREWWGRALSGRLDPEADPIPARWAFVLIVGGILGMIGWMLLAHVQWWAAVLAVLIFIMVLLILTRVVAESGLFFVQSNVIAGSVLHGLSVPHTAAVLPVSVRLTDKTITTLAMHKAILMHDLREVFMPYVMSGVKAGTAVRQRAGKLIFVFALTALVGLIAAAYGRISTSYKYGGVNLDWYANIEEPSWVLKEAVEYQKTPPTYDWLPSADHKILPVNAAHVLVGGLLTAGMLVMRARFLWWPLHPFGLVMCGTWAISMFWFSIMLGNVTKWAVMTFGGASTYRKLLPLFLGFILGECLISVAWMIVGLVTRVPGRPILPN